MQDVSDQTRRYRFGSFDLNLTEGELRRQGNRVKLNDKPFTLLCVLLERAGHLVTREELRQRLWSADTYVDFGANLNTALSTLRHALGDSSDSPLFIETVPRQGYRFIAPVTVIGKRWEGSEVEVESKTQGAAGTTLPIEIEGRGFRLAKMFLAVAAFFVVTGAVSWVALKYWPSSPEHSKLMILVTPFENLSGDPGQEYLSDGLTDEMITRLGQISPSRLSVIARSTAMQYKHTQKSLDQIARECRPDYILEGSVRRENNRLRITGQLFKSGDQGSLWTQAYDLDAKDLLIIQRDVADRIARSLSLEVLPQRASAASGANPLNADAYDEYLKGLFELNQRTESALRRSITSFETATAKDPNFAAAYASLAAAYNVGAGWNFFSPADSYPKAKAAAQKALSLDESLPDAHAAYAEVLHDYDWDWGDAEREYQRTLELNPSSASGHKGYAEYLTHAGRYDAALAEIRRAQALDPGSLVMSALVCYVYYHAREYEKAIHECGKVLELDPTFVPAHYWRGTSYIFSRRYDDAVADFRAASDLSENANYFLAWTGLTYALEGNKSKAKKALRQLESDPKRQYVSPYGLASIHLALGDRESALQLLERACQERAADSVFLATAQEFDSLHNEPRFRRMISLIEFPRSAAPYAEARRFRLQ
jgi:TolB-like protein/DNA-binding winged helix-turn-helix (wHTH) protein/Tfp pilus assembly protein PilF